MGRACIDRRLRSPALQRRQHRIAHLRGGQRPADIRRPRAGFERLRHCRLDPVGLRRHAERVAQHHRCGEDGRQLVRGWRDLKNFVDASEGDGMLARAHEVRPTSTARHIGLIFDTAAHAGESGFQEQNR